MTTKRLQVIIVADAGQVTLGTLDAGKPGIDQTAAIMRGLVKTAKQTPTIRRLARQLPTLQRLYAWLQAHHQFEPDPVDAEVIRTPDYLARLVRRDGVFRGDCDDVATLAAAIVAAWGETPALGVIGPTPRERGGRFKHVFPGIVESRGAIARGFKASAGRWNVPGKAARVCWFDPQENRPVGHSPNEPMARVYLADGPHA